MLTNNIHVLDSKYLPPEKIKQLLQDVIQNA